MNLINKGLTTIILAISGLLTIGSWSKPNLKKHQWKNRILLVQGFSEDAKTYQDQIDEFSHSIEQLAERKLVLYEVQANQYKMTNYQDSDQDTKWITDKEPLKNILGEADVFKVILMGLDGRAKLEKKEVLTQKELFAIIDSMPMRAAEMERNK